jgi:membrane protein implicated in regulation of membrane protease activity
VTAWHYWLLAGIVLAIAEVFAPGFVLICFGLGAGLVALFTCLFGFGIEVQILVFAIATLLVFAGSRTLFHDILWPPASTQEHTNVDALLGKHVIVVDAIPGGDGKGSVRAGGEEWTAISADHRPAAAGTRVLVQGIDGNKLVVRVATDEPKEIS